MDEAILKELQTLKENLAFLSERIRQLEQRVKTESSAPAPARPVAPPAAAPVVAPVQPRPSPVLAEAAPPEPPRPLVEAMAQRKEFCRLHPKHEVQWLCASCRTPL